MNKKKNWKIFIILIIGVVIIMSNIPKIKDLSPKFKIPSAEKELEILLNQERMGDRVGGLSLFSDSFKRGYGDAVFGSDSNGIWLGAADFSSAPFRVDMDGKVVASSIVLGSGYTKINIFKQDGIPTSISIGDLWFDTNDKNKVYIAESVGADEITAGEWVIVRDTDIAQAISDAATAQGTADGKVTTFYQATAPTAEGVGDLWVDTDDDRLYRWSGAAWVEIQDADIATAIANAGTAQSTADSKIVTFYQDGVPTATDAGDLWVDTNDNNKLYRATAIGDDQVTAGEWEPATLEGVGQNFVSTLVWTATDADTATWASGTIKTSDGVSYSIAGGNTGNIGAKTYIYLDPATSVTVLQTSITATDAVGNGIILIAIVQEGAVGAKCIIDVVGSTGTTIDGNRIITGKIQSKDGSTFFDLDGNQIQIQDGTSTTIIDSTGLVSTANFIFDSEVSISTRDITSIGSFVDVSGTTIVTPNFSRNTNVLILVDIVARMYLPSTDEIQWGEIVLRIDSTDKTGTHWDQVIQDTRMSTSGVFSFDSRNAHISVSGVETLGSGTHTLKLRAQVGGQTLRILQTSVMYIVLGK